MKCIDYNHSPRIVGTQINWFTMLWLDILLLLMQYHIICIQRRYFLSPHPAKMLCSKATDALFNLHIRWPLSLSSDMFEIVICYLQNFAFWLISFRSCGHILKTSSFTFTSKNNPFTINNLFASQLNVTSWNCHGLCWTPASLSRNPSTSHPGGG